MAVKIFVNYRREDERAFAARVRDRLAQAFGASNVFMDVDNLMAGQRFDRELEKALVETDVFLAVMGPRWLELFEKRQASGET
jgi:TIR domain-containing protein